MAPGHGDNIKENLGKKLTFVAFSEDEKRIMTLSSDGVVIIRDLKIKESKEFKEGRNVSCQPCI
ncbi:hypothetical protein N9750_05325 [Polaribacter sp.]|nr:hypothetical protein [Polaribacter sp.]